MSVNSFVTKIKTLKVVGANFVLQIGYLHGIENNSGRMLYQPCQYSASEKSHGTAKL